MYEIVSTDLQGKGGFLSTTTKGSNQPVGATKFVYRGGQTLRRIARRNKRRETNLFDSALVWAHFSQYLHHYGPSKISTIELILENLLNSARAHCGPGHTSSFI